MLNGRPQPSCDGTSRITPECQVQNAARMRPTPKRNSRDECRRDRPVTLVASSAPHRRINAIDSLISKA
jgi:hypothetical protein